MDKQRLILEEFLTKKLKYSSEWHPTVLKYKVQKEHSFIFYKDEEYYERIANMLLGNNPIGKIRSEPPYVHIYPNTRIIFTLGEEFNYWADRSIPLILLSQKSRVITECIPDLPIGPFLKEKKPTEWWVQYLLDGNNFLIK